MLFTFDVNCCCSLVLNGEQLIGGHFIHLGNLVTKDDSAAVEMDILISKADAAVKSEDCV